ncbi:MAG: hypothetical protein Q8L14_38595 [Myxococcales bacterium]|nr:hypothetical protein [Myxococcales bacterium]
MPAQTRLVANINATWDTVINLIEEPVANCGAALSDGGLSFLCVAAADAIGSNETVNFANRTASARTIYIHVDGWDSTDLGDFVLTVGLSPIPAGEVCDTAEVLTLPASRPADTLVGFANDLAPGGANGCASGTGSVDRMYRVTVPANNRLTATVVASTNSDGGVAFAPTINIVAATATCGNTVPCLSGGNSAGSPGTATATLNNGAGARDVIVIVDTATASPEGTFSLSLTAAPATQPVGDLCVNVAAPIAATTTLQSESFSTFAADYSPRGQTSCEFQSGLDRVYAVTIPVGQIMTATATATDAGVLPDGGFIDLSLSVIDQATDCNSGPCLGGVNAAGTTETVVQSNTAGTTPRSVFLVVDSNLPAAAGTYSLNVNLAAPLAGDTCSDTLMNYGASISLMSETLSGYSNDFSTAVAGCAFEAGSDRVYRITIPAGFRLNATTTTAADHALSLITGPAANCAAPSCLTSSDVFGAPGESLRYDNLTSSPLTVFLVVDRFGTAGLPAFGLTLDLAAAPMSVTPGLSCSMPTVIPANGTVLSNTTGIMGGFAFADTGACKGQSSMTNAPDGVFQITIPANSRTTITTRSTWDAVINVVDSPDTNCGSGMGMGIVCLAGADSTASGAETVSVSNTSTTTTRTVFLIVDGWADTDFGTFEIETATSVIPPPGYTKTTTSQACTTLAAPTALIASVADDSTSPVTALPLAFSFFGTPVTHFAATTNGNVQFFAAATGTVSSQWTNAAIPTAAVPNGFAAPFWDDLHIPNNGGTPAIRYEVTGTAPNQVLTVEWFDIAIATGGGGGAPNAGTRTERLNFQVKLFETTNVVEFHYCSLVAGTGSALAVSGSGATVGLENSAGTAGVQHSFNTGSSVNTTDALRFTP